MYLFGTGFGEAFKPRSRKPSKPAPKPPARPAPKHRLVAVVVHWDVEVPFIKDFKAYRQEVVKEIGTHVAANERHKIDSLMTSNSVSVISGDEELKKLHDVLPKIVKEHELWPVRVALTFQRNEYTGLENVQIVRIDTPLY